MVEQAEAEQLWISECFHAVFQSPTWNGPIGNFVDANCGIFEDVEENKLDYTLIHNAFKQLIDDLLTASLMELNVTPEQFTRFCEQGLNGDRALPRSIIEHLLSVDDFLVFKAMMVKRNADLNRETICGSRGPAMSFVVPHNTPTAAADEDSGEVDTSEAERLEAQRKCVEAELQLAIALSYQLEQRLRLIEAIEERLRLIEKLSEVMEAAALQGEGERDQEWLMAEAEAAAAAFAQPMPELEPYPEPASFATSEPAPLTAPTHLAPVQAPTRLAPLSSSVALRAEEEVIPVAVQLQPLRGSGGDIAAAAVAPTAPVLSVEERYALEKKRTEAALQRASAADRRAAAVSRTAEAQPLSSLPVNVVADPAAPAPAPAPAPSLSGPTEEERRARAEHLKRQRELLVEKKNRERESQLNAFQHTHGATAAARVAERRMVGIGGQPTGGDDAGRRLAAELSGKAPCQTEDCEAAVVANSEAAAIEMRRTITRQLKQTLTGNLYG